MSSKDKKKAKLSESESASSSSSSDSDSSPPPRKDAKTKSKSANVSVESAKGKTNSLRVAGEKEPTWELGSKKFITIGDFKGKTYINIREYYTDAKGDVKPGKKGIGLNIEQWQNLCNSIDEVNQVLK
ncbi:activated RNA polymerase II transcriptional coactivator p15 [Bradysia coprophila]|uniref:activated RNA polymerase II transcriptional coactivator p15 n=1 Tax=Bradysia coprophila TaxID=38358 RepID=UPI00187DD25A|nr:activated RNA polymerase II transcriptional coactivator p15 [Bradysia coprophila]XP_037033002.1 activated RNA polymerase II transcriptional coactivator p15 [Bradysia coprophila]